MLLDLFSDVPRAHPRQAWQPRTVNEVRQFALLLLRAVAAVNALGYVHRDIKVRRVRLQRLHA